MDIPADLVDLRRAFEAADLKCQQLSDELPSAQEMLGGTVELAEGELNTVWAALREARTVRLDLVMQMHRHAWWGTVKDKGAAQFALQDEARKG